MAEVNSVEKLCNLLISCAFRRCRLLDDICRLSISLKPSPPHVQLSVSDTGVGSHLEEFQNLKYQHGSVLACKWGGVLCVSTTSISDTEIHHLKYDFKQVPSRRVVTLPSETKNGAKFSGTEVSVLICEQIEHLLEVISVFVLKMLVLRAPKIAVQLSVSSTGCSESMLQSVISHNACSSMPVCEANVEYLKLGLEDYVYKHGNRLNEACHTCLSTGFNLKVGSGVACSKKTQRAGRNMMEVVIIISDSSQPSPSSCTRLHGRKTEVLYFRDFSPSLMSESSLEVLINIDWKKYGLNLKSTADQDGVVLLEWENLPQSIHIDIVLHRYHTQLTMLHCRQSSQMDQTLTRKAVKLALNDLKENNDGALLSERASKVCNYAPDLSKTLTGLILSSHDLDFQKECFSLLGLQAPDDDRYTVEKCIKDRILSVITVDDRNSNRSKEARSLFTDEAEQQLYFEELEEGEESIEYMDL